jgi:cytochrome c-type biogenesis protein CcsB
MQSLLLWLAVGIYGIGVLVTLPSVIRRRPTLPPAALGALGLGLLLHAGSLSIQAFQTHHLPVTDVRSALSFFALMVTGSFFFIYLRYRLAAVGLFMLPLVFVLTLISALRAGSSFESTSLRSGWLTLHIGSMFLGYTGLFLAFVAAVMYLIQERELKSKRLRELYFRLPSLEVCDELYYRSLLFGFPLLTLGIVIGFVSASREWRGPWEFDPKILASLVTWLIYLVLFATRLSGSWQGRKAAYVAIFAFAAVMVTFVGVSFLSGQHGFVPNLGSRP